MKIIAVTGARSEYDLLSEVFYKLNKNRDIDFSIIVTGPHLSEKYGLTLQYIEADGYRVADKIYNLIDSDSKQARVQSIGHQIPGLVQSILREQPDIVLVAGDREEALSVTTVCAFMDIKVAHFFGGDIAKDGNIDNSVRFAASKLAHIHFPTLEEHKRNLIKLGEDEWRIFTVGNPALDRLVTTPTISRTELFKNLNVEINEEDPYCVLIQHSIITEVEQQDRYITETLEGILRTGIKCFINYPNSDAGNRAIIDAYKKYTFQYPHKFWTFQNLDRKIYINLLRGASCLVGNSSSGILEAPTLGLPVVNVGSRQRGRTHADNVIFVENNRHQIFEAINKSVFDGNYRQKVKQLKNPYGNGNSSQTIVDILLNLDKSKPWIHKNITY